MPRRVAVTLSNMTQGYSNSDTPKVMIAIIGTEFGPWKQVFLEGQCATWLKKLSSKYEVIYVTCKFFGNRTRKLNNKIEFLRWSAGRRTSYIIAYLLMGILFPLRGLVPKLHLVRSLEIDGLYSVRYMNLRCLETLTSLRWKKISVVKYFLNSKSQYLLLVNPSTYVSIKNLEKILVSCHSHENEYLYAGQMAHSADSPFVVGSFILLNRKSAELLIKGRWKIPTHTLDDVAFGKFLSDRGVQITELPSLNVSHPVLPKNLGIDEFVNFRIKMEGRSREETEVKFMKSLYQDSRLN